MAGWNEDDYLAYLQDQRRRYAWVMHHYGDLDPKQAEMAAMEQYPFEPSDEPYRGLVFHDHAWHWAMLAIHGNQYWLSHPHLEDPPAEYRALH